MYDSSIITWFIYAFGVLITFGVLNLMFAMGLIVWVMILHKRSIEGRDKG
jgi:hypothetical protein